MNKPVDVLYDEFVDSIAPEAILSKLKKSELIELLMYAHEDLQRLESYVELELENEMLHYQIENQNGQKLEQYTREMDQAKQMQDDKLYAQEEGEL